MTESTATCKRRQGPLNGNPGIEFVDFQSPRATFFRWSRLRLDGPAYSFVLAIIYVLISKCPIPGGEDGPRSSGWLFRKGIPLVLRARGMASWPPPTDKVPIP